MSALVLERPVRAVAYGVVLWLVGMVVGSVVFAVPALKGLAPIPRVASNPAITASILVLWPLMSWFLASGYLRRSSSPHAEGLALGLVFVAVNAVADAVILVNVMKTGVGFYSYAGPWVAYATLVLVPHLVSRTFATARAVGQG